jgi:hypothetical protein
MSHSIMKFLRGVRDRKVSNFLYLYRTFPFSFLYNDLILLAELSSSKEHVRCGQLTAYYEYHSLFEGHLSLIHFSGQFLGSCIHSRYQHIPLFLIPGENALELGTNV